MAPSKDRLHGILEILILKTLSMGKRHGYSIARAIEERSEEQISVEEGSLYPALYRMERRGWISAEWGMSELGRKAKFYSLTRAGRKQLQEESAEFQRFTRAVLRVLSAS